MSGGVKLNKTYIRFDLKDRRKSNIITIKNNKIIFI